MSRSDGRDSLAPHWLMVWCTGRKMDGADVAGFSWCVKAVQETGLKRVLVSILSGREGGGGGGGTANAPVFTHTHTHTHTLIEVLILVPYCWQ
jgi:hypothetical protein